MKNINMEYYKFGGYGRGWNFHCSPEETSRLGIDKHLERNRARWETPEPINLFVDTNYPDHEDLDFNNPILRNSMIWAKGGSYKWHKSAPKPFTRGVCLSDAFYQLLKTFHVTNEQFLVLNVHNYQKKTQHQYWLYYPIRQWEMRYVNITKSIFKHYKEYTDEPFELIKNVTYAQLSDIEDDKIDDGYKVKPTQLRLKAPYDFLFDGYNFIVSEKLKQAIAVAGMDDIAFYDLDYEVVVDKEVS